MEQHAPKFRFGDVVEEVTTGEVGVITAYSESNAYGVRYGVVIRHRPDRPKDEPTAYKIGDTITIDEDILKLYDGIKIDPDFVKDIEPNFEFEMGTLVKCKYSKKQGHIVRRMKFLNGCYCYGIFTDALVGKKEEDDIRTYAVSELELVEVPAPAPEPVLAPTPEVPETKPAAPKKKTGGPSLKMEPIKEDMLGRPDR